MNGFLWTLLTSKKTKKIKNNLIKNKIERANTELNRESDSTKPQSQTRMFSRRKKTFLSFTLSLFYLFVAPVMQVLPVYSAEPAEVISVWEVMETQLVAANSIITEQAVVNAYNNSLGTIAANNATAEIINIGLQNAAQACGVDLAPIFENTVESAASVGLTASAASAAENIAASCASVGSGSIVLPAIGGACVVAGIVGITAGLTHICGMINEMYRNAIECGTSIANAEMLESFDFPQIISGGSFCTIKNSSSGAIRVLAYPACFSVSGGITYVNLINPTGTNITGHYKNGVNESYPLVAAYNSWGGHGFGSGYEFNGPFISNINNYLTGLRNGTIQLPYSQTPDLASVNGPLYFDPNATSENNPEIIIPNIPELRPLPDYANGYGLMPIPEADYQNIVTYINEQPTPNTLEDQEEQRENIPTVIKPLIDPYIVPIGDPSPGPGEDPQPTGTPDPEPTGSPDPQPTGSPNPKPNTNPFPDPETVPAPVPYPDPETPTEQDKTDTDTKITPIDLRDKFPFCIPFDILKIMKLFQGGREAPCFTWEIPFGEAGSGTVTVDLSPWDSAATLLRTLELILFIMLLAVGTRNLIGGSS